MLVSHYFGAVFVFDGNVYRFMKFCDCGADNGYEEACRIWKIFEEIISKELQKRGGVLGIEDEFGGALNAVDDEDEGAVEDDHPHDIEDKSNESEED